MSKSYYDYIKTGQIDPLKAAEMQVGRERARSGMAGFLNIKGLPSDALAFGALDVIAVKLVEWFGAASAGEVLRHYASVCERRAENVENRGDWMQTAGGRQFWPLSPSVDAIDIEDIAHALAHQCRFAGHCLRFYSVAEHSVHIARAASDENKLRALMHDAAEAYVVDVIRPLKPYLVGYKDIETRVHSAICERFRLPEAIPDEVLRLDGGILVDEMQQNMAAPPAAWNYTGESIGARLEFWTPEQAKAEFLKAFSELSGGRQ